MLKEYLPNILLVDDDSVLLKYLEAILKGLGANIIKALSGREALEKTRDKELAVAVMDIHMPEMDGYELATMLQKHTAEKVLPIIFLTGMQVEQSQILRGYQVGAVDYLIKPVEKKILISKVKVFLELDRQRNQIEKHKLKFKELALQLFQVKRTLKKSEERLNEAQKMGRMGHWEFFLDTQEISWSDQVFELLERNPDLGMPSYEEIMASHFSEASTELQEYFRRAEEMGESFKLDHPVRKQSGEFAYHSSTINPVKNACGQVVKLVGTVQDITERKRAEIGIKRRLEFERIFTNILFRFVGLFDYDTAIKESLKDICEYCEASNAFVTLWDRNNPEVSETYEWKKQKSESLGDGIKRKTSGFFQWLQSALQKDKRICIPDVSKLSLHSEEEGKHLYGEDIRSILVFPLFVREDFRGGIGVFNRNNTNKWSDEDENLLNVFSNILGSATHQKSVEQDLVESEEMYRTLLNASPDGIIITDLKGRITQVSNMAVELFDAENCTMLGKRYLEFIPIDLHRKAAKTFSKTLTEGLIQNVEFKLIRNKSSQFIGEISTTLIQEANGNPKAYMAIIRDITQRKKMEKHLIHTERMAGVGEMATGIAHEINQPLNTISMSMDNLLASVKSNTYNKTYLEKKANKIFDNIFRMRNIIDHVRTFSRDHEDCIPIAFNINESITNATSMISEQLKHRGILLKLSLNRTIDHPIGNTYKFEQVILNLLSNAKDAIEEKKKKLKQDFPKEIEIRTYQYLKKIYVEVKDNGGGIDQDKTDTIMLPFYTTKKVGEGTGLGLSISFGIIKEMEGNIEIQSRIGEGTTIRIVLPCKDQ
ncbi:MAG: PAS domain S-box protein [Marinifilaceae bacterium]